MAKKKSVPVSRTRTAARKTKSRRSPAAKTASKAGKARKTSPKSVDGILKTFDKERIAKNSTLVSTRRKIEKLTKQVASIKTELEDLKKTAVETEIAIETLDSRRDAEIGVLLSGMGIDMAKAAAAAKPKASVEKSTPLFDGHDESKRDGDDSETTDC